MAPTPAIERLGGDPIHTARSVMYATIIRCDLRGIEPSHARGQAGRTLATALSALPGFLAFVALDAEDAAGMVAVLCIVEDRASLAAARRVTARWQQDAVGMAAGGVEELGAGAVIAQRGL
jgi:hypothetical protein